MSSSRVADPYERRLVACFMIFGEPASKARARFTGYGSPNLEYTPELINLPRQRIAEAFAEARPGWTVDASREFAVSARFFPGTRQRRDVDNMVKLVLDACNGVVWVDDMQVTEISGRVTFNDPDARTEVTIHCMNAQSRMKATCDWCGEDYQTYLSWIGTRRFCTPRCAYDYRKAYRLRVCPNCEREFSDPNRRLYCSDECIEKHQRVELACERCGNLFTKPRSWANNGKPFCSDDCRVSYWRDHRAVAAQGTCSACGGPTSKKSYQRCRACRSKGDRRPKPKLNRTHCPKGHPYDAVNTYIDQKGVKSCRVCRRAANNRAHERRRAQAVYGPE
jgi:crossover junction endodeoxyribonuclease RusA